MKLKLLNLFFLLILFENSLLSQQKGFYPINPIPFTKVELQDNFWLGRAQTNKEVTIPFAFKKSEETGRIANFKVAGGLTEGTFNTHRGFDDSDVFKIIDGKAYQLYENADGSIRKEDVRFKAIPYYGWANRGASEMLVWIPIDKKYAIPKPSSTIEPKSKFKNE